MSKPKNDSGVRQLATWVPASVKDDVAALAAKEKKPEREVVTEALKAHVEAKREKKS